jgi:superfamily II DNA/RNA helicase
MHLCLAVVHLPAPRSTVSMQSPVQSSAAAGNMAQFHSASHGVLVSTDVAARGLDFPAVTHILQFDPPGEIAEYVQRVGRTARMGRRGIALLFLSPSELEYKDLLEGAGVPITQQKLYPAFAALPRPPALSKRAAAEPERNRRDFQVAMDAAHHVQARSNSQWAPV